MENNIVESHTILPSKVTTSGAVVVTLDDSSVMKMSTDKKIYSRLAQQVDFMLEMNKPIFPIIKSVFSYGYVMEYLQESTWFSDELEAEVATMKMLLNRDIWSTCSSLTLHPNWNDVLFSAILERLIDSEDIGDVTAMSVLNLVKKLKYLIGLTVCPTHGDPTFSNVMLQGARMRIVDPLPWQGSYVPPLKAVDLGKILQSLMGYESVHDSKRFDLKEEDIGKALDELFKDVSDNDRRASWIFCAIHYVRLLPYQKDIHKESLLKILEDVLYVCENF
jgi:hypothetical protein